ncbi:PepSY domain-containing protein [Limnobacter parvus]|uniref:PepSY domain-containing protein n=1 Tax=Limnobacter parvus TaxID=2939690 RepID=A0ABT1XJ04_9BURK|nr:PepSY domain-containing protein [Limnobacter parvus]MCR2747265.1 PepSY domain-containing protein [Limnobacter parvus]
MMRRPTPTLAALTLALLLGLPAYALADDDGRRSAEIIKTFDLISADQARAIALKEAPGVVTELELDDRDYAKGWKWEVEVVDADGREVEVDLDAKTGKVLKIDKDWF